MKLRSVLAALLFSASLLKLDANDAPIASVADERSAIADQITAKAKAGPVTAESLAADLAAIDALLARHPGKSEDAAQIALLKASVYWVVLRDEETSKKLFTAILADFEGTNAVPVAQAVLETMTPGAKDAAAKRHAKLNTLVGHPAPELHFTWSSRKGLKTLSSLRGKVVVLDFWATWCVPCIASFPQLREEAARFANAPVVFLGVTSLQKHVSNLPPGTITTKGDPAKEIAQMSAFMKAKNMTWDVAISEEALFNPDYGVEGIPFVVIIAPDGTVQHVGASSIEIASKVAALLAK